MALSIIALILSILALGGAFVTPWVLAGGTRRAFRRLERDVDDMWEKVESHLGRVSRLKRDISSAKGEGGAPPEQAVQAPPALTRASLLRMAKRGA